MTDTLQSDLTREVDGLTLPTPGTFVISRDGIIRLAFVDPDYTRRLEPEDIVQTLRALPSAS